MKIRNRHLIRLAGKLGTLAARGLYRTLRFEYGPTGMHLAPRHLPVDYSARHIYCIWHENLLLPAIYFGEPSLSVLISKHADGQLLGALIEAMGMGQVLGSTNRGGFEAVRGYINDRSPRRHLAITPDGPRGPRRIVQPGVVYIASRTGMKIVCVGIGYQRPWRVNSWDRFAFPKPFSRARCVTHEPIAIPPNLKSEGIERHRRLIQIEMDRLNAIAQTWADTNRWTAENARPVRAFLRRAS